MDQRERGEREKEKAYPLERGKDGSNDVDLMMMMMIRRRNPRRIGDMINEFNQFTAAAISKEDLKVRFSA